MKLEIEVIDENDVKVAAVNIPLSDLPVNGDGHTFLGFLANQDTPEI